MRIALCLHGLVGSIKGKNYKTIGGSDKVLKISYKHNKNYILDSIDSDVFVHSWSTELRENIIQLYNPKSYLIEPQIQFPIPKYIKADSNRIFAHLSRWYSYKKAIELMRIYEKENNIKYDFVLIQRFDLIWNIHPEFNKLDKNRFYVGKCTLDPSREWSDRWFISSPPNMEKFSTLYDKLEIYMSPEGEFPSNKQYEGISSHFLTKFHANKLGLNESFIYNFGGYNNKPNHYNEVRRQYYGNDN